MNHRAAGVLLGAAAAGVTLAGCNIVGPAYFFIHGPEKVKKVYTLDEKQTTVIFVDDRQNHIPRRALRLAIAEEAEKTLLAKKVVKDMIASNSALVAAGSDKHGKPVPIAEIGRAAQADIVIYATVDAFTISTDGQTYAPTCVVRVKVVSAADDKRLWPEDPAGHPVRVRMKVEAKDLPTSVSARYEVEDALARRAGTEIAWLFFDHDRPTGPRVPD